MDRIVVDQLKIDETLRTPVINQILEHKSVRKFDTSKSLPRGVVDILVAAAQSAPTSSNFQSYSIIVVEDKERIQHLQTLCDNQKFIGEAPLFLVFCGDASRHKYVTERQNYSFGSDYLELLMISVIDSVLAAQNAATSAESLGLGTCMVGAIRNQAEAVAQYLNLPPNVFATVGLAIGYSASTTDVKPRLPKNVVVHRESYNNSNIEEGLVSYDEKMAKTNIYDNRRIQIPGVTPEIDNGHYGWIEHTARRMARGNDFRRNLAPFLEKHGFTLK